MRPGNGADHESYLEYGKPWLSTDSTGFMGVRVISGSCDREFSALDVWGSMAWRETERWLFSSVNRGWYDVTAASHVNRREKREGRNFKPNVSPYTASP